MKKKINFLIFLSIFSIFAFSALAEIDLPLLKIIQANLREASKITLRDFQKGEEELRRVREELRLKIRNEIREEREKRQRELLESREQLREKLRVFKEEEKRRVVEVVYERINNINRTINDHYLQVLDHLEDILLRIESRGARLKIKGVDISELTRVILKAQDEIDRAREKVKNQAERVYLLDSFSQNPSAEEIKTAIKDLRQQLHADLKSVQLLVQKAKEAVREAVITLAQLSPT